MKWLLFHFFVFTGLVVWLPSVTCVGATKAIKIESIVYTVSSQGKEDVVFQLSGANTPKMFTLAGEKPRLVIDFFGAGFSGKKLIPAVNAELATAVRVGVHRKPRLKTRVVVDLSKKIGVRYQSNFSKDKKTFTVTLEPAQITKRKAVVNSDAPVERVKEIPSQEPVVRAVEKKTLPAVSSKEEKKEVVRVAAGSVTSVPELLDITFDNSSNRGEMVLFRLNDFYPPSVSALEKDNPRVLCEFPNMSLGKDVQADISTNGKFVKHIRTTYQKDSDKVKVVLDLSPDRDYDLQQVFFKNDNLFVLIINELPLKKTVK